jgi:hypothetical protein
VLVVFLAAGAFEVFGSKTDRTSATAAGYTLTVTYPSVTRPGLPIRWEFEVTHPGGFDQPIRLATTFDYLHLFDTSNLEPEPVSSTGSDTEVIYVFDPPPGDDFRVSIDERGTWVPRAPRCDDDAARRRAARRERHVCDQGGAVMQILVRSVALFLFVWIISRAIGRKELAGLSSFELILLIVMGTSSSRESRETTAR